VVVTDPTAELNLTGTDESYRLEVLQVSARITAATPWGAMRALETFSQLVMWDMGPVPAAGATGGVYTVPNLPLVIEDAPRFPWRGLMLDTARHWYPVAALLTMLDAMSYNKLNALHWHATDDNSWSLASQAYPNFSKSGAFCDAMIYSKADVATVVQHARERGIVVYFEFDVPAHAGRWGSAYPNLTTWWANPAHGTTPAQPYPGCIVEPTGKAYAALATLTNEVNAATKAGVTHFGGDEVGNIGCWASDPFGEVQAWAKKLGAPVWNGTGVNTTAALGYFEAHVGKAAEAQAVAPIFWADAWTAAVAADTVTSMPTTAIFQSWSGADHGPALRAGFRATSSAGWYLDQTNPGGKETYAFTDNWNHMWQLDPLGLPGVGPLSPEEQARFLGGEVAMWSEKVDATNVQQTVWPRSCAPAERLWSPYPDPSTFDPSTHLPKIPADVNPRLEAQRCRMVRRGIAAGPTTPQTAQKIWSHRGGYHQDNIGYTGWSGGPCVLPQASVYVAP
jgi:hexosaminidase